MRSKSHWNSQNIKPQNPVGLGLCSGPELEKVVIIARGRAERAAKKAARETAKVAAKEQAAAAAATPPEAAPEPAPESPELVEPSSH